jgi:dipeptidyl aminopeptidase/acylaminoacyl peptidase
MSGSMIVLLLLISLSASKRNLSLTAQDAIAGVNYLKSNSEINGDQIGLTGFSQAGGVIPLAASRSSENNLKEIMTQGKSNFTYFVLPNADHNLQQTTPGLFNEIPYSPGYHQDYYKTIVTWLDEHVK